MYTALLAAIYQNHIYKTNHRERLGPSLVLSRLRLWRQKRQQTTTNCVESSGGPWWYRNAEEELWSHKNGNKL